ncbi:conserved oligomeric Golgi complex subunit 2-like [Gigantopelta aegis]|uniref:conserved oligomeric Golgi complex subunit 2-like n=1 Tax=Gigantopelta aegis TaxID=1735272 RepID=UPI001B88A845|nr:conserved oligomeric Golgi complex subunit 2-like [Gigantopelta aegis]
MTVDAGKGFTLPSGPSNLCFDKEEFMKTEFHVDKFVVECRRHVQLESLRDDLNIYLKILKSAMIELINKDYADFVNLSTNLVGMDKAISSLTVPLGQLKEEVLNVQTAMDEAIAAVEEKLKHQQEIQNNKACLQRLLNITQSVEKIEHLLGIKTSSQSTSQSPGQLSGQLIERVATEFNKLQFYVTKSRGLPLVEKIKPRIAMITTTLQYSLEGSFLEGLETNNVDILRQCLRTYALIDKTRDAETLFRQHVVKPYLEEVITEEFIRSGSQGLRGMFAKVVEFIPKKCKVLKDVTSGGSGTTEVVRGYDFLVNSVWPEIVSNLEARTPSIFAPGNPDIFHEKYLLSMEFLARFERMCGSQASVKRLRDHASYQTFMTKWSLPVYFQIRFQEIAGAFEFSLITGLNNADSSSEFQLLCTSILWEMLGRGWAGDVFLPSLVHRFWKLDLQLLSRYTTWLDEIYEEENTRRKDQTGDKHTKPVSGGGNGEPVRSFSPHPPESSANPPITIGQIVCLICDSEKLTQMLPGLFDTTVLPRLQEANVQDAATLKDCLDDCKTAIEARLPKFQQFIVGDIITQCSVYLKQVSDIPRLYRRTNREVPSKPSTYAGNLLKPLRLFVDEHRATLGDKQRHDLLVHVFTTIAQQYYDVTCEVLTSVKKMEDSLKRLKKARGSDKSSGGTHGMTDDDKIRQQLCVDVATFGKEVESFGVSPALVPGLKNLQELAEEAKATISS